MARLHGIRPPATFATSQGVSIEALSEARRRFQNAEYVELHRIECRLDDGVLMLCGIVSRYYLKQRAFHVVANLAGIRQISNDIRVECHHGKRLDHEANRNDGTIESVPANAREYS